MAARLPRRPLRYLWLTLKRLVSAPRVRIVRVTQQG
jgi:hypothetical protein